MPTRGIRGAIKGQAYPAAHHAPAWSRRLDGRRLQAPAAAVWNRHRRVCQIYR